MLSRSELTRKIVKYVKDNALLGTSEKRHGITPDAKLAAVLHLTADDKLSILNLSCFLKPHVDCPDVPADD